MSTGKKILFIGRTDDRVEYDTSWSMAKRMQENGQHDIAYEHCYIEDIVFAYDGQTLRVYDGPSGQPIKDYDGIFFMGWFKERIHEDVVMAVARYAEANNVPLLNPEVLQLRSRSKLSQYVVAALHHISSTAFVVVGKTAPNKLTYLQEAMQRAKIDFPVIVKAGNASRGNDNYLVKSREELIEIYQNNPQHTFVLQRFVPNDGDYRLLVMGDRVRLAIHRLSQSDSHINNTSKGGAATVVGLDTLDPIMLEEAVTIAKLLRRTVTGVDMIVDKTTGRHYFLEANNMPQLSTGSNVPHKMRALDDYLFEWLQEEARRTNG